MQCENVSKCKKKMTNSFSCNKCTKKFCSNSCMIDHYFETHQTIENESTNFVKINKTPTKNLIKLPPDSENISTNPLPLKVLNKKNSINSSFIKSGVFLKEIKYEKYFEFKNFEKVKLGKKFHVLGAGAFGDVYLVKHKQDGKFFAVKQMEKTKILETGAKLEIVRREIDIHMRLLHPNIIRLYSYHEDELSFYLIMDYANSGTLFSTIRKSKGLDEKRALKYFIQTAAAVHFIHENNLVHRDLKPENLLVDEKDDIKLCDFGWCIELEIGNRTTFCGTIEYMAPEIIKEMPYDKSIDVWSLGILLYELLHGYSPFRAQNENDEEEYTQVFKNIIKYKLNIDRNDLSENCKDLIMKLLTPQNNQRYKTKDIFTHPWVTDFEFGLENMNIQNKQIEQISSFSVEEEKIKIDPNSNNKNLNKSVLPPTDSLFDKVLIQVKERNKDKRKKSKFLEGMDLNFDIDSLVTPKEETTNDKIVLKATKEKNQNKTAEFKMLKEIQEIESNIDKHIDDQNQRYDELKTKKDNLKNEMRDRSIGTKKNTHNNIPKHEEDLSSTIYTNLSNNNSKKNSVHSSNTQRNTKGGNNNLINLQPKNYNPKKYNEDEDEVTNENIKCRSDNKINTQRDKHKHSSEKIMIDYNDILYSKVREKERDTHRSQRNTKTSIHLQNENKKEVKDVNKELDLSFLPKEVLYNDVSYEASNKNILSAIEMLEKVRENKKEIDSSNKEDKTVWDKFSDFWKPFKCGQN